MQVDKENELLQGTTLTLHAHVVAALAVRARLLPMTRVALIFPARRPQPALLYVHYRAYFGGAFALLCNFWRKTDGNPTLAKVVMGEHSRNTILTEFRHQSTHVVLKASASMQRPEERYT